MLLLLPGLGRGLAHVKFKEFAVVFVVVLLFLWISFVLLQWLLPLRGNPTLVEIVQSQWQYLLTKRIW